MKLKFYSQLCMVAMAIALTITGCNDDDKTIISEPITFDLQITDVGAEQATLVVKPSEKQAAYLFGVMTKTEFDAFSSENDFLSAEISRIQELAKGQNITLEAYLKANCNHGDKEITVLTTAYQTAHYAYVYGLDANGKTVSKLFKIEFTSGEEPARAPDLEIAMIPGDAQGLDKDIRLTISGKSAGVISGRLLLIANSELEAVLAQGSTIETIINNDKNSYPFEAVEIEALNSENGWKYSYRNLTPGTAYTSIIKVTNEIGATIKTISASTLATAGSNGPELDLKLTRGNADGQNKNTDMTTIIKATGVMAGRYGLFKKSQIDAALESGYTLSYIIENNGATFTQEQIDAVNSNTGLQINIVELEPNMPYTFIAKVANADGTTIKTASQSTTTGIGPVVKVSMVPGDKEGKNTDVNMLITTKSTDVISSREALMPKADFDAEIAKGTTPTQILDTNGTIITASEITALNSSTGLVRVFSSLLPNTAYMHIAEAESENGTSIEFSSALTTATNTNTSDITFGFEVEDLSPTSAILTVIPSIDSETYYFDYLEVSEFNKRTDAEWISSFIGTNGISNSLLNTGIAGYDAAWFDYMALTPGTEYYLYAFGYDAQTKSATTGITKHTFTTPTGKETPTDAYKAWLGTWTVTSTSSEKDQTAISFDISISQKVVNNTYTMTGWGITSYRTRNITVTLKSNGDIRVNNQQQITTLSTGVLKFTARYMNPATSKYALVPARVEGIIGTMAAGNQLATVNGGTFSLDDGATTHTITAMDCFNNKHDGSWVGYTALAAYKNSGYPIGPYTLTKKSSSAANASVENKQTKAPLLGNYKIELAKRALVKQKAISKSSGTGSGKNAVKALSTDKTRSIETLNLSGSSSKTTRSAIQKVVVNR